MNVKERIAFLVDTLSLISHPEGGFILRHIDQKGESQQHQVKET